MRKGAAPVGGHSRRRSPLGLGAGRIHAGEIFGEPSLPTGAGFALQPIDEIDHGVEAAPGATADAGPRNSYRQMQLAGAGSADQHGIALFSQKGAARQIAYQRLIDRRPGEVEVLDVPGLRRGRLLASGSLAMVSSYLIERAGHRSKPFRSARMPSRVAGKPPTTKYSRRNLTVRFIAFFAPRPVST